MSALRSTLRIARRDALRHKARSALIVAMVAIPVLGLTAADVLARTMQLSAGERVSREIGQADVGLTGGGGRVTQGADPASGYANADPHGPQPGSPAVAALQVRALALIGARPGSTTVLRTSASVVANGREAGVELTRVALNNPLTAGIASIRSGRAPVTNGEIAVTPLLAQRLHLAIGGQLGLSSQPATITGQSRTITGIVRDPNALHEDGVYLNAAAANDPQGPLILAATSRPVTWSEVRQLNALGFIVTSRSVIEHPPPGAPVFNTSSPLTNSARVGVATVSVGLAVLEVVLLAGAAFAVGARRQRRDLALVAAAGGDTRHVRQIVLAGGLVLGIAGGVLGLVAGIGGARLALPEAASLVGRVPGHFDLRAVELLAVLLLGIVTGVIASVLPARTAGRDDVVSALTGRRGVLSSPRRIPATGLAMVVLGAVLAFHAARKFHFREILAGAVICELGFVVCAPSVVGATGRLARFLPLAPRLALRDAARHRGRSGPAVAAVMAAIAGSIAVSTYFVSTVHRDRENYTPAARIGQPVLQVSRGGTDFAQRQRTSLAVFARDMDASRVVHVPTVSCVEVGGHCTSLLLPSSDLGYGNLAVGGAALLRDLSGRTDPAAEAALAAGKVVAFSRYPVVLDRDGGQGQTAVVGATTYLDDLGSRGASFPGIISPATAARLQLRTSSPTPLSYIAITTGTPTQAQQDQANAQLPTTSELTVERGYSPGNYSIGLIALALTAGLVTLGATAISVGLSMAESKPDLVTLAAVGGRPRTRRLLVASQAGTVALLGAVQGVVAGLVPAWAILHAVHTVVPFVLPWTTILVVVIGVPLLAMLGTAAFAGSRLTLDRRLT